MELRKQIAQHQQSLQQAQAAAAAAAGKQDGAPVANGAGVYQTPSGMSADQYMGSHEAVASLLDLRSGFDGSSYLRNGNQQFKRIEDVIVVNERVTELFNL